ncbi:dipeptide epimerase [Geomonas paludis]|uniref:Dipeptide epimerase n=1 Tax=Geomonas paludis TaxID=2740185 RepID=A0A6V8MWZ1_9BACT|nr:enolase C-terminal domain-like protein [Geomonas paludis]UPU34935.1 dipeptide epimerase [Geomonas paludis]GFO64611.1 L-Ala-D/L-Glu epimerase [Geomonas paludis]
MEKVSFVIDDAQASIIRAPLATPFRISTGQHDELENVFIRLRASDGAFGFGEAAVATHITGETVPETLENLQSAASALRGRRISDPAAVCREFAPAFAGNHAALAALEMALLDLSARVQGIPFYRLFAPVAPMPQLSFKTDITVVIGTVAEARATAKLFAERGFTSFKIKIGRDEEEDLQRILAVREMAPGCELILDANMAFNAQRMLAFLDRLDGHEARPVLLEQPVPKQDWEGLAEITAALEGSGTLVCADESVGSLAAARRAVETNAVSAINIKFMKSGILEGAEIARLAAANGKRLMLGAMMESALAITASAHFAAALGCFDFIDLDTTFFLKGELSRSPYLDDSGRFDLTGAGSGIGVVPELP